MPQPSIRRVVDGLADQLDLFMPAMPGGAG
jgi:hypothetical protein